MSDHIKGAAARAILAGLLAGCPRGDTSDVCQFCEKRKLTFDEMFEWVQSLSEDEVLELILTHDECHNAKLIDHTLDV